MGDAIGAFTVENYGQNDQIVGAKFGQTARENQTGTENAVLLVPVTCHMGLGTEKNNDDGILFISGFRLRPCSGYAPRTTRCI
jgi:hypothetical protein